MAWRPLVGEAMANTFSLTTLCETIAQSMLIHPTPAMGRGGDGWSGPFLASCQFFDWPSQPVRPGSFHGFLGNAWYGQL